MMTDTEMLKTIQSRDFESLWNGASFISSDIIKNKIQEIPTEFFEPRICIDEEGKRHISLIQFSTEIAGMSSERKRGMMEKYHINPYDMKKLQAIVDSIRVAREYGTREEVPQKQEERGGTYGFSLASDDKLSKAYPLWLAYLFADSKNPLMDIKVKLKEDGMEEKYKPETIVGLIEHTNSLMKGKNETEKKDFYMQSISSILEEPAEAVIKRETMER